jgi:hypothetical protein
MGFLDTIKQKLGIGGVKMQVTLPGKIERDSGTFSGTIALTTKTDQYITELEIEMIEEWSIGKGENKEQKTFELGKALVAKEFSIKPGEIKTFNFTLEYELINSENDDLKEGNAVQKGLGKFGSFLDGENSKYFVKTSCDVKGVIFSPSESTEIKLS